MPNPPEDNLVAATTPTHMSVNDQYISKNQEYTKTISAMAWDLEVGETYDVKIGDTVFTSDGHGDHLVGTGLSDKTLSITFTVGTPPDHENEWYVTVDVDGTVYESDDYLIYWF